MVAFVLQCCSATLQPALVVLVSLGAEVDLPMCLFLPASTLLFPVKEIFLMQSCHIIEQSIFCLLFSLLYSGPEPVLIFLLKLSANVNNMTNTEGQACAHVHIAQLFTVCKF